MISFTIPGITPPSVNHAWRHRIIGRNISTYATGRLKAYKRAVIACAEGRTVAPSSPKERAKVQYAVSAHIYLGKAQRGDVDNFGKALLDGLQAAGVIHSDARVKRVTLEVHWDQRDNPRTEVEVKII